jgi:prolyl-tRNA synthetase
MQLSTLFGRTLRDAPAEAEHIAYQLALRAGLARPLLAGGFALLPLGMRVARQIEAIMHEELAQIGGQEFRTPVVQSVTAWEQSGRFSLYGSLILRFTDRSERSLIMAPTHEEAVAELARREITSYRHMPALIYQIHTKYRDELRVRGGLMRMREFTMLDAYTLDADWDGLDRAYERMAEAFERIFTRCGVHFVAVEAGAGEMGGREPREYMALSSFGEDTLVICPSCGYAANSEVAVRSQESGVRSQESGVRSQESGVRSQWRANDEGQRAEDKRRTAEDERRRTNDERRRVMDGGETTDIHHDTDHAPRNTQYEPREEVATPNCATIADVAAFLGVPTAATAKAVFFDTPERGLVFVVIRGDMEVNEAKLKAVAHVSDLAPAGAEQIAASGAVAGYASPVGLTVMTDHRPPTTDHRPPTTDDSNKVASHNAASNTLHPSSFVVRPSAGVFVIADQSVVDAGPLVAGANKEGYHLRNVVYGRDWGATVVADIAAVRAGDACVRCGAPLTLERGVEIGHIFKLGTHFTEALDARYLDRNGVAKPIVMGSYGIGIERMIQVIIDQHHDDAGIIWPAAVAPFDVQLLLLGKKEETRQAGDQLYAQLEQAGIRTLYDDREETPGVKFADADLLGFPLRVIVSERLVATQNVEIKPRAGEPIKVNQEAVVEQIRRMLSNE